MTPSPDLEDNMNESQAHQPAPAHMPGPWATWDCKQMQARGVTGPTAAAAITATAEIKRLDYAKCSEVLTIDQQVAAIALGKTQAEAHANARLIAAAPEMLEALQLCFDHCRLWHPEVESNNVGAVVRAAIAKATGA